VALAIRRQKIYYSAASSEVEISSSPGLLPIYLSEILSSPRKYWTTSIFLAAMAMRRGFQSAVLTSWPFNNLNSSAGALKFITVS